ncbi:uncharacterized protein AMSG_04411 [Thecamonas trahens ATCC 50062]|uniref:Transmembrane protein n=1 Tax=Thecamonas trahens ATCC 50062 TaxID=461836 RepID=A0A0L0D730_THETB|nr:hypothetical protein AMSG_04411 [Thecamonas trahens ATCC 50062]KNC48182.1 hypothetical protein AMSG_04411 [Thecamonas trahens ATCC 50062]|eukprot:XP_013758751.1 hypothetical protein AMSG_04411 [Thecamonas trahens ATCC 50062]
MVLDLVWDGDSPRDHDALSPLLVVGDGSADDDDDELTGFASRGRSSRSRRCHPTRCLSSRRGKGIACAGAAVLLLIIYLILVAVQLASLARLDASVSGQVRADQCSDPDAIPFALALTLDSPSWFTASLDATRVDIRAASSGTVLASVALPHTTIRYGRHTAPLASKLAFNHQALQHAADLASVLARRAFNASYAAAHTPPSLILDAKLTIRAPALLSIPISHTLHQAVVLQPPPPPPLSPSGAATQPPPPPMITLTGAELGESTFSAHFKLHAPATIQLTVLTPPLDVVVAAGGADGTGGPDDAPQLVAVHASPTRWGETASLRGPAPLQLDLEVARTPSAATALSQLLADVLQPSTHRAYAPALALIGANPGTDAPCLLQTLLNRLHLDLPQSSAFAPERDWLSPLINGSALDPSVADGTTHNAPLAGKILDVLMATTDGSTVVVQALVNASAVTGSSLDVGIIGMPSFEASLYLTPGVDLPPTVVADLPGGLAAPLGTLRLSAVATNELIRVSAAVTIDSMPLLQALVLPALPLWEVDDVPQHLFTNPLFALREFADSPDGRPLYGLGARLVPSASPQASIWSRLATELRLEGLAPSATWFAELPPPPPGAPPLFEIASTVATIDGPLLSGTATCRLAIPHVLDGVVVRAALPQMDAAVVATSDESLAPSLAPALHGRSDADVVVLSTGPVSVHGAVDVVSSTMAASALSQWMGGGIVPVFARVAHSAPGHLPSVFHALLSGIRWRYTLGSASSLYELRKVYVAPITDIAIVTLKPQLWLGLEWLHLSLTVPGVTDLPVWLVDADAEVAQIAWSAFTVASDAVNTMDIYAFASNVPLLGEAVASLDLEVVVRPPPTTAADSFITALLAGVRVDPVQSGSGDGLASLVDDIVFAGADPASPASSFVVTSGLVLSNNVVEMTVPPVALRVVASGASGGARGTLLTLASAPIAIQTGQDKVSLIGRVAPTRNATLLRELGSEVLKLGNGEAAAGLTAEVQFGVDALGAESSNLLARILSGASFKMYWNASAVSGGSSGLGRNVSFEVVASDVDFVQARMRVPVALPAALPDVELGLPSMAFRYSGASVGSVSLSTNVLRGGGRTTFVEMEGVVSAEASRVALEGLINKATAGKDDVALDVDVVLAPGTQAPAAAAFTAHYPFVFPARASLAGASAVDGMNSVVQCTELVDLDFGYFAILEGKCEFTARVAIYIHNPSPLRVTVSSLAFDVWYDNPHGVCLGSMCIYSPASNLFLTHVDDPSSASSPAELPTELVPGAVAVTEMVLAPSSVEMCLRVGNEYERNDHQFHIHVTNGVGVVHVENMVLHLAFELPDYVVRNAPSPPCTA